MLIAQIDSRLSHISEIRFSRQAKIQNALIVSRASGKTDDVLGALVARKWAVLTQQTAASL
jgi:hypothetical protein